MLTHPKAEHKIYRAVLVAEIWLQRGELNAAGETVPVVGSSTVVADDGLDVWRRDPQPKRLPPPHVPQMLLNFDASQGRLGSYGLGWNVSIERGGRAFWKHSGGFALGLRTEVALLPSQKLALAVLSNSSPSGVPEGLTESFFDLVLNGRLQRDWIEFANRMFDEEIKKELGHEHDYSHPPARPLPPLNLSAYAGRYANDFFGPIELDQKQGRLVLRIGPKPLEFPLRHYDRDVFVYQPTGESAGGPSGVRFSIDPDRQADRVLIENLNIHGQGAFTRVKPTTPRM